MAQDGRTDTHNPSVEGSIPSGPTRHRGHASVTGIRVERLDARLFRRSAPRTRARLSGAARRAADVVVRTAKPQSRAVIELLKHLGSVGFDAAPDRWAASLQTDASSSRTSKARARTRMRGPGMRRGTSARLLSRLHQATASTHS